MLLQKNSYTLFFAIVLSLIVSFFVWSLWKNEEFISKQNYDSFEYNFAHDGILHETGNPNESTSPYFWLDSGGELIIKNGLGMTMQGGTEENNKWRRKYSLSNPRDTDNGLHPQNLFRLLTRGVWDDSAQEIEIRIKKDNLSQSSYRNESNGVLLFHRYIDNENFYYAGIRVDGGIVIKKKIKGTYYTLGYLPHFNANENYDRNKNPNLLPKNTWIGIKSETKTMPDKKVLISFYLKTSNAPDSWSKILESIDDNKSFGGKTITQKGHSGIRTDFMDVEFKNYKIVAI